MKKPVLIDGKWHEPVLTLHGATFDVRDGERVITGTRRWAGQGRLSVTIAGRTFEATVVRARRPP